jgi:hypothetical protein
LLLWGPAYFILLPTLLVSLSFDVLELLSFVSLFVLQDRENGRSSVYSLLTGQGGSACFFPFSL